MKRLLSFFFILFSAVLLIEARVPNPIVIPDVPGYHTLKLEFHVHTVFSDGSVWPTTRVQEAWYEGLDGLSITDHIEAGLQRTIKKFPSDRIDRNTSWKIAFEKAKSMGLICIHGCEITLGSNYFPGHFNAHFISDVDALAEVEEKALNSTKDKEKRQEKALFATLKAAREQGAFLVWNHPNWIRQAPVETEWYPIHERIYNKGLIDGIEIINQCGGLYSPEAFHWAIEKNLAVISGSDAHGPMFECVDWALGEYRPMTLVFAKGRTEADVREALDARRTAVLDRSMVYGPEAALEPFAKACLTIENVVYNKNGFTVHFKNNSSIPLELVKAPGSENLSYNRMISINTQEAESVGVRFVDSSSVPETVTLNFYLKNFEIDAGIPLKLSYTLSTRPKE